MDVHMQGHCVLPQEVTDRNVLSARARGLPAVQTMRSRKRLAIVGGGPSVRDHLEEIRAFDGDIWAINATNQWLRERDIASTSFSVDPQPELAPMMVGSTSAVLAEACDPSVFDTVGGVPVWTLETTRGQCGSTSASAAFWAGIVSGHEQIVLYGCESSISSKGETHVDRIERFPHLMTIEAGGKRYLTEAGLYVQAQELATIIKTHPTRFSERSGGLLRGLIENEKFKTVWVSPALREKLRPQTMIPEGMIASRLQELIDGRKKAADDLAFVKANIHAYDGAIKECRHWLAVAAEANARAMQAGPPVADHHIPPSGRNGAAQHAN